MIRPVLYALAAMAATTPAAEAAESPLTAQVQSICLPFVQGRNPVDATVTLARQSGYRTLKVDGVFTTLTGPTGKLLISNLLDGSRACGFERPVSTYRTVVADFKAWIPAAPGGPYRPAGTEGPDVEGQRYMGWRSGRVRIEISENYDENDELILVIDASSRP